MDGDEVKLWLCNARFLRAGMRILLYVPFVVSKIFGAKFLFNFRAAFVRGGDSRGHPEG